MDEWRRRLRPIVAEWGLAPEDQEEIVEELAQHLDDEYRELAPRLGADAARDRVLRQLHDPRLRDAAVPPRHRSALAFTPAGWLASLGRDVRYGWRSLTRRPGLMAAAGSALALGIGLTTMMFSMIHGGLLRGLPFDGAGRIGMVTRSHPEFGPMPLSFRDFALYRSQQRSFERLGGFTFEFVSLSGDGPPERLRAYRITPGAFDLPRVPPLLGRALHDGDGSPGGEPVVVLSHALWRDRFASDSAMIGRTVRVNRQPHVVVGVMPERFAYPDHAGLWLPLHVDSAAAAGAGMPVNVIGRLREGATFANASAEAGVVATRLREIASAEGGDRDERESGALVAQAFVRAMVPGRLFSMMYAMFAAVGLVFLVACANVANLLLDRAVHRSKEIGVRTALGASRGAIVRQFMIEAMILSVISAAAGTLIAHGGLVAFNSTIAHLDRPAWVEFRLYLQVIPFVVVAALAASFLSGLLPAYLATRTDVNTILKDQSLGSSSHRAQSLSKSLVVLEIGLSSALLVGAALMTKSVIQLRAVEPGFRTADVLTAHLSVDRGDTAQQRMFIERLEQELRRLPGAVAAAVMSGAPGPAWSMAPVAVQGAVPADDEDPRNVRFISVTPGFFDTFGVAVVRGRAFAEADRSGSDPVAIVNQRFAKEYFPGIDPVGQRIRLGSRERRGPWRTVVGVVPNLYATSVANPWPAEVLTPLPRVRDGQLAVAVRAQDDPLALVEPLRKAVAALDADLPLFEIRRMDRYLDETMWFVAVFGTLFIVFGVVALVIAAIGLYAVMGFSVTRREREMAIRMTLGAHRGDVLRTVGAEGARQILVGTAAGLALGAFFSRLGRAVLFDVEPHDPVMFGVVVVTLGIAGLAACLVPALRATRVDPAITLRSE